MSGTKKFLTVLLLGVFIVALVGCNTTTSTTTTTTSSTTTTTTSTTTTSTSTGPSDTVAPVISMTNTTILHQTNAEVDLLAGITVSDNVATPEQITLIISDFGGYDRSVPGTYTITIRATDPSGNFSTVQRTVIVRNDILAPIVTGTILPLTHLAGEVVQLTRGISAVDNVDGTNVIFTVSSLGTYNRDIPGTYVIQFTLSDAAGNVSMAYNRTIIVEAAYTRAEMTDFNGNIVRYQALYNPQVFNSHTGTGYNSAYDGHYVNVLSKAYLEWLLANAPERLGAGVGWSVIAVTNANDEIVYVRHWNSGEAFKDQEGVLRSVFAEDWSTGTIRTWTETVNTSLIQKSNAKFTSPEMGLMMANINRWVPEGGHVFMFLNWSTIGKNAENVVQVLANTSDMPRSMGANHIMNSDEDDDGIRDYAIGRTLQILNPELTDTTIRKTFDPASPFPVITIPGQRFLTDTGIWRVRYEQRVFLQEYSGSQPYNPLLGITATDGLGNDITNHITYKFYRYTTPLEQYGLSPSLSMNSTKWAEFFDNPWVLANNELSIEEIMLPTNHNRYFIVEFTVEANGQKDVAYRLINIQATDPDYIELYGPTDTVFSRAMGLETRLAMNPNLVEFGPFQEAQRGIIYTGSFFKGLSQLPQLSKGVVVVLDQYYRITHIRFAHGLHFEMDRFGVVKSTDLTWTHEHMLSNLKDLVLPNGYVLIYPEGFDQVIMNRAFRAFYDFDFDGALLQTIAPKNGVVEVTLPIKEVQEVTSLVVNDVTAQALINNVPTNIQVIVNNLQSLVFSSTGGGAGFRLDNGKAYYYTRDMYITLSSDPSVVSSFTTLSPNKGVPWFRDGVLIIFDAEGKFVSARVMTTTAAAEVFADGTVIVGNAAVIATSETAKAAAGTPNLTWDLVIPHASNTVPHGPLMDILNVVPTGGSFLILPGSQTAAVRNYGIQLVWNQNYPGAGVIVDKDALEFPQGVDPLTNGFSATYNAAYFQNLKVEVKQVSTVVAQMPKLVRPVVTITDNIASWVANANASMYHIIINGVKVGETTETSVNLKQYIFDANVKNIQIRAITKDVKIAATSIPSIAVPVQFTALSVPQNIEIDANTLTWDAVTGAESYRIFVNDVLVATVANLFFDLTPYKGQSMRRVQVQALPGATNIANVDSVKSEVILYGNETTTYLKLGNASQHVTYTTAAEWLVKRNITVANGGFAGSTEIFLIEDAGAFLDLENKDVMLTVNGTMVLFSATGQVKAVRTVLNNHEWLATNDPQVNNGWTINATYVSGQVKVNQVTPYIAMGDFIILSNNATGKQTNALLTPRDFLAFSFVGAWDTSVASAEIWRKTVLDGAFVNPTSVVYKLNKYEVQPYLHLALEKQHVTYTTVAEWLVKRNVTIANGGFSGSPEIFYIEDAYAFANETNQAQLITANGTMVLFSATGQVKAVRTVLNNHEWLATNDPLVNQGWTIRAGATSGQVKISEVAPLLAEGDFILATTSSTAKQFNALLNARDFLAYHFVGAWDRSVASSEIWRKTVIDSNFVNPATVTYSIKKLPVDSFLTLPAETQHVTYTTVAEWLVKRNITVANGGFSGSNEIFYIEDAFQFTKEANQAQLITANGTMVLFSATHQVKAVRTVLNNHEWLSTNDLQVNNGWTIRAGATSGQVRISEVAPLLAEGDYILVTTAGTSKQAGAQFTARDFLAYHFVGSWDTTVASSEIWRKTVIDASFVNPTTVTVKIHKLPIVIN